MSRSLIKDVSLQELHDMRENGMTNHDIAESLGVSLGTIYRHIGPQNFGTKKRREYVERTRGPEIQSDAVQAGPEEAALIVDNRVIGLAGLFAGYRVNIKAKEVAVFVEDGVDAMIIPFDQLETFSNELRAISKHVNGLCVGNEMW